MYFEHILSPYWHLRLKTWWIDSGRTLKKSKPFVNREKETRKNWISHKVSVNIHRSNLIQGRVYSRAVLKCESTDISPTNNYVGLYPSGMWWIGYNYSKQATKSNKFWCGNEFPSRQSLFPVSHSDSAQPGVEALIRLRLPFKLFSSI